jgi:hypothetical protein
LLYTTASTIKIQSSTFVFSSITTTTIGSEGVSGLAFNNVSWSSPPAATSTIQIYGNNTFSNLTFGTYTVATGFGSIILYGNLTVTGTLTISGSGGFIRPFIYSSVIGVPRTITVGAVSALTDVDFRDITISGATWSGTRLGNAGGNTNITFPAAKTVYFVALTGGTWKGGTWALSSGGAISSANYPLAQDTAVINDAGLNTGTTITNMREINVGSISITKTNAFSLTSNGGTRVYVYGDFTATTLTTLSTVTWTFAGRSTQTLTSAGRTFGNIYINKVSNLSLNGALTCGTINYMAGGLVTNGNAISASGILGTNSPDVGAAITTKQNFSFTLGASTITISSVYRFSELFSNQGNGPTTTITPGTSTISDSGGSTAYLGMTGQNLTFNNVSFTFNTVTMFGNNTFANITWSTTSSNGGVTERLGLYGNQTITGTLALAGGASGGQRIGIYGYDSLGNGGTQRTITAGAVTGLTNVDIRDVAGAGAATWSGTRVGNCGGNSGITFTPAKTVYYNSSGSSWSDGFAATSGGLASNTNCPLPQDTAVFNNANTATTVLFGGVGLNVGSIDLSARTTAVTFSGSGYMYVYGNITFGSGITWSFTDYLAYYGAGTFTLTTAGKTIQNGIIISNPSCSLVLGGALTSTSNGINVSAGSFSTNNFALTYSTGITTSTTASKTINFGSSTVTITANTGGINLSNGIVNFTGSSATIVANSYDQIYNFAGNSIGTIRYSGLAANNLNFTGNARIGTLTNTTYGYLILTTGITLSVTSFTFTGISGTVIRLMTDTPAQPARIGDFSGNVGVNSTDGGDNKGLSFTGTSPNYIYVKNINGPSAYNPTTSFMPFF